MRARDGGCGFGATGCLRARVFLTPTFASFIEPNMEAEIACGFSWCLARRPKLKRTAGLEGTMQHIQQSYLL